MYTHTHDVCAHSAVNRLLHYAQTAMSIKVHLCASQNALKGEHILIISLNGIVSDDISKDI